MSKILIVDLVYKEEIISVSSDGRVFGKRGEKKQRLNADGYPTVTVGVPGKRTGKSVHRLMGVAFFDIENDQQINHKDGVKTNNNLDNLEAVSQQDNLRHAFVTGLRSTNMPAKSIQAINKQGFGYWFFSQGQAATFGFTQANVSQAIRGVRPTCKGFTWSFV